LSELLLRRWRIKKITCNCDNEADVEKIKRPIYNPGAMSSADMDVILAIKKLVDDHAEVCISFQHVKGHADKDKPKNKCTRIEQINIDCDEEAEKCVEGNITPTPYHPRFLDINEGRQSNADGTKYYCTGEVSSNTTPYSGVNNT
jgi:hypothetical protein